MTKIATKTITATILPLLLAACPGSPATVHQDSPSVAAPVAQPRAAMDARAPIDPPVPAAAAATVKTPSGTEELRTEDREANPLSEKITLKLIVYPTSADATIFWGGKKLGKPVKSVLELERPRNSGPMDVVIRASEFLPFHTRLFTDRDDKLVVHLVHPAEAPSMLGYHRAAAEPAKE